MATTSYKVDAKGKSIGRIATEVASMLMGKTLTSFQKHIVADVSVTVENANQVAIPVSKLGQIRHKTYSGYPGGLKERTLAHVLEKKGYKEALVLAISRMIPRNRMHKDRMKRLVITD